MSPCAYVSILTAVCVWVAEWPHSIGWARTYNQWINKSKHCHKSGLNLLSTQAFIIPATEIIFSPLPVCLFDSAIIQTLVMEFYEAWQVDTILEEEQLFRFCEIIEEGFMTYTTAHHQGAINMLWLHFWSALHLSIVLIQSMVSAGPKLSSNCPSMVKGPSNV